MNSAQHLRKSAPASSGPRLDPWPPASTLQSLPNSDRPVRSAVTGGQVRTAATQPSSAWISVAQTSPTTREQMSTHSLNSPEEVTSPQVSSLEQNCLQMGGPGPTPPSRED